MEQALMKYKASTSQANITIDELMQVHPTIIWMNDVCFSYLFLVWHSGSPSPSLTFLEWLQLHCFHLSSFAKEANNAILSVMDEFSCWSVMLELNAFHGKIGKLGEGEFKCTKTLQAALTFLNEILAQTIWWHVHNHRVLTTGRLRPFLFTKNE